MAGRLSGWWERFQPWPFYREPHFNERTQRAVEEVWEQMRQGYDPREDPESPYYKGRTISKNPKPSGVDYGETRYALVEKPDYLRGRQRMAQRGADLAELDFVIGMLLRGMRLTREYDPHKLKGDKKGLMECHIKGYRNNDWVLVYQYDHQKLVLYAVDTGTHKDCNVEGRHRCCHPTDDGFCSAPLSYVGSTIAVYRPCAAD